MIEQRDLHTHQERAFLIPSNATLPGGDFVLRRVDGVEVHSTEAAVAQWEVSAEEAQAFHELAMADAMQRMGALMGVFTNLMQSANAGQALPRPHSMDGMLGLEGSGEPGELPAGLKDAISGLAKLLHQSDSDPEAADKLAADVAATWDGPGGEEIGEAVRSLPGLLRDAGIRLEGLKKP